MSHRDHPFGFTLIETMIVIAIIAAVLAIGGSRLFNSKNQMRASVRKLTILTREIRNVARLQNSTARLVIHMGDDDHSYWVESAPGQVLLTSEEQEEELERLTDIQREQFAKKGQFKLEARLTRQPVELPKGLFFEDVEWTSRKEAASSGHAYIHFLPQGLSEEAVIHLTDRKTLNWTIVVSPLTGRADLFERKITLKELSQ